MPYKSHKTNKSNRPSDKTPLWVIMGVILGAIIVYLAMSEEEKGRKPAIPKIETSVAESVNISAVDESGIVLAGSGDSAKNDAPPGSSEAPERSGPLTDDMIPKEAIRIQVTKEKFSPADFTARPGEVVTLALTSGDAFTHVLAFENIALQAIALGVSAGETRVIRFNAPEKEGDYVFYQNMPGFYAVRGTMLVEK